MFSPKTRRWKTFGSRKNQPRSITTLPMQLSKKQIDRAKMAVENERQKEGTQWAIEKVESVSKKFKKF